MREKTKKLKATRNVLGLISFLLCYMPLLVALGIGFSYTSDAGRVSLTISCAVALLLTIINTLMKYSIRSTMWVLLLGIYLALDNVMPYLIAIAICTIVDEFIISPLYRSTKNKYTINKEIDDAREAN